MSKRKSKSRKNDETSDATDATDEFETDTSDASEPLDDSELTPEPESEPILPTSIPENPPEPILPRIPLRVFEKIAGAKLDQLAGFKRYAKNNKLGPMSVPEWREALQAFWSRPTNPRK